MAFKVHARKGHLLRSDQYDLPYEMYSGPGGGAVEAYSFPSNLDLGKAW